jgi:alpha-1,3-glucan synthase
MSDVDLIWVIPKVSGITYPRATPKPPIYVTIFGSVYQVNMEEYNFNNLTYVLLDSPVFMAQSPREPYPQRMDELTSAIYCKHPSCATLTPSDSTWNQSIAAVHDRYSIDIYHINDYHGGLAPLYLLPKVIPVVLSLHNADFQGSWPLRNQSEIQEVSAAFNLSDEITNKVRAQLSRKTKTAVHSIWKHLQFATRGRQLVSDGNFRLLTFNSVSIHQCSIGVAGVSEKYGKRSWARYPALWALKSIEALPNPGQSSDTCFPAGLTLYPDPSDVAGLDKQPMRSPSKGNMEAERERPANKRKAQEWAKLEVNPHAQVLVFVGRWSKQKGVDLIADAMVSL